MDQQLNPIQNCRTQIFIHVTFDWDPAVAPSCLTVDLSIPSVALVQLFAMLVGLDHVSDVQIP